MLLLIIYVLVALVFSFMCSIAEAVILSVRRAHIAIMEKNGQKSGAILRELKADVNKPLAAILTLNTIAHTVGAAGAGAQAAVVFGSAYVGVASAILTLLILVFSEIIPKTLGAHYWRALAPVTAYGLKFLIYALYPFVKLSEKLTGGLTNETTLTGFSRDEFTVMAELGAEEGELAEQEFSIFRNLLLLSETDIESVMTPRMVVFSMPEKTRVDEFFHLHDDVRFSRIPIYRDEKEDVTGFVLRNDLLLAQARGEVDSCLADYRRDLMALLETMSLSHAFDELMRRRAHLALVVDEYGGLEGIVTMEDILETLLGTEIVDESDREIDMQALARTLWRKRAREMGMDDGQN
jgi:CBS domain containing-hemolysin-like protein